MTGYDSKRRIALDRLDDDDIQVYAQPEPNRKRPIEADYTSQVAYTRALEAYCDTSAQPAQEPPSEWALIKNILDEYGLQAISFVADWKAAQPAQKPFGYLSIGDTPLFQKETPEIGRWETLYTTPQQRPWVGLTDDEVYKIDALCLTPKQAAMYASYILEEKNA